MEVAKLFAILGIHNSDIVGNIRRRVFVEYKCSALTQQSIMPTIASLVYTSALACLNINGKEVALDWINLVRGNNDALALGVKAKYFHHNPLARCKLLDIKRLCIVGHAAAMLAKSAKIKVVVTILLALHYKLAVVPWQEHYRMLWLNILLVGFAI